MWVSQGGFKRSIVLSFLLFVLIKIAIVLPVIVSASDVTEKVTISGFEAIKENGSKVTASNPLYVNEAFQLNYSLRIDQEERTDIEAGDTFSFFLPDSQYIQIIKNFTNYQKPYGIEVCLEPDKVVENYLTVKFAKRIDKQKELTNLKVVVKAKAIKAGKGISTGGSDSVSLPPMTILDSVLSASELIQAEAQIIGTGKVENPRPLDYIVIDKAEPTIPIAYGVTEQNITKKGEFVKIIFFRKQIGQGLYEERIETGKENSNWRALLKDGHSYCIRKTYDPEYRMVAADELQVKDDYVYRADNPKIGRFYISNQTVLNGQTEKNRVVPPISEEKATNDRKTILVPKRKETTSPLPANTEKENGDERRGIRLTKVDTKTGRRLQGAEFELKNAAGEKLYLRKKLMTNEHGELFISNLPEGTYSFVEVLAPDGYLLDKTPLEFTFSKDEKMIQLVKKNTLESSPAIEKEKSETNTREGDSTIRKGKMNSSSSANKQYPATGMENSGLFLLLGWSILTSLFIYNKK